MSFFEESNALTNELIVATEQMGVFLGAVALAGYGAYKAIKAVHDSAQTPPDNYPEN